MQTGNKKDLSAHLNCVQISLIISNEARPPRGQYVDNVTSIDANYSLIVLIF